MMENFRLKEVDLESEGGTISKTESYEDRKASSHGGRKLMIL